VGGLATGSPVPDRLGSRGLALHKDQSSMEIQSLDTILEYLNKVQQRTMRVVRCIPADKLDWSYADGKFTLGELVRHMGAIERYMFGETIQSKPSLYKGCGRELADSLDEVIRFKERMDRETVDIIRTLGEEGMARKCITPDGASITVWKWLRLMVEHEIHHRGQIYIYLAMLNVPTPPLYGLTSEQLIERVA
jgi:uncharacterized damage-inducible protein DinB